MRGTIKLRPQQTEQEERKLRLRPPARLAAELDEYRKLVVQVLGHEIDLPVLIEGICEQSLASDRAFQRHTPSARVYEPPPEPEYPFHDKSVRVRLAAGASAWGSGRST